MTDSTTTDDRDLDGLDPYALFDREAARIDAYLTSIHDDAWQRPSRCAGWTVRDVTAHLAATEEYHHACLDGTVGAIFERLMGEGVQSLDDANDRGVRRYDGVANADLVDEWRTNDAETRRRFRERDGATVDSSVGAYPARWQAFHLACELATHADDMGVPITDDERADRLAWRVRFSRFALVETKPELEVTAVPEGTRVVLEDGQAAVIDDATFVEAVAARLDGSADLAPEVRAALSNTP